MKGLPTMGTGEIVLRALSRPLGDADYASSVQEWTLDTALELLQRAVPCFDHLFVDRSVLDYGCGAGWQSVALAKFGARQVLGVDTNPQSLASARSLAAKFSISPDRLTFGECVPIAVRGTFDVVISQNSMEHFAKPAEVLREMKDALHPRGRLLITFGPPWLAPYGSHMHFFTKMPWVNVFFSETTVMRVRQAYRDDGAMRYEEVESGLNRMTVRKFERLTAECGMRMQWRAYSCVKRLNFLSRIPLLREFFINNISCVLVNSNRNYRVEVTT